MEVFIINIENEVFSSGEYSERYTHTRGFAEQVETLKFIKENLIPDMTQEKIDYYVDEDIKARIMYEDDATINVGIFSGEEMIERISFEVCWVYLRR